MPPITSRGYKLSGSIDEFPLFEDDQSDPKLVKLQHAPAVEAKKVEEPEVTAEKPYKIEIVWKNVVFYVLLHAGAFYGAYLLCTQAKWQTWIFTYVMYVIGGLGITAGAHRLWAHKSYKATRPMSILLMLMNCVSLEDDVIQWARDHRVHHKFTETDADPYNARRGFFFSHAGWLLVRKHPMVKIYGKKLPLEDLENDPVLQFQKRHYKKLALTLCFGLPTVLPWLWWGESMWVAYFTAGVLRYIIGLNLTWTVNSLAHMYGSKPYDIHIFPTQNFTCILGSLGEGFHNYHHTYPWDYRASEHGWRFNITTSFIDLFSAIGWVYDRKIVNEETIQKKKLKSGQPQESIRYPYVYG